MQFFDVVTALTISGILAILALYIIVVYKKGWLKRNHVESHFLCPNPDCRKSFSEPVLLTDLSITPPESYPACPHCSINLHNIPFFSAKKKPSLESIKALPSFKEPQKPIEKTQPIKEKQLMPEKPTVIKEVSKPAFPPVMSSDLKKAALQELKLSVRPIAVRDKNSSKSIKPNSSEEKKTHPNSQNCPHFFGYVRTLPKSDPIPDECLGCPWIVQCLIHAKEVEALQV